MGRISEDEFRRPDRKNPAYSMMEYDLYAKLNLSIRKNLRTGNFETYDLWTGNAVFTGTLEEVVKEANALEGSENTVIIDNARKKAGQGD